VRLCLFRNSYPHLLSLGSLHFIFYTNCLGNFFDFECICCHNIIVKKMLLQLFLSLKSFFHCLYKTANKRNDNMWWLVRRCHIHCVVLSKETTVKFTGNAENNEIGCSKRKRVFYHFRHNANDVAWHEVSIRRRILSEFCLI